MAKNPAPGAAQDSALLLNCYREMQRIRKSEQRLSKLFANSEIPGFIHLSIGQESVPVGISAHLKRDDTVAVTHRGHGQALAKGIPLAGFFAEMMGRDTGICRGRGGSMHIADAGVGMLGANGIVGGGIAIAVGSALAHKLAGAGNVAVCYFGDGALAEGVFHECINLAALWSLPVLFACENNGWGEFSPTSRQFRGNLALLARAFGVDYEEVDGSDALAVSAAAAQMVAEMRSNSRPAVLECHVARFEGHFAGDPQKYRSDEEKAGLAARDPVQRARLRLLVSGVEAAEFERLDGSVAGEIDGALDAARAAPLPDFATARAQVYAGDTP